MPIKTKDIKDITIITADVDWATIIVADSFKNSVQFEIAANKRKFIFNLSSCEFIDSTFLSAIITSYKRIVENGGNLAIVGLKPAVKAMFQLTRLDEILEIHTNEKEGLSSLA